MEEKVFTEDEKELLELIEYTTDIYSNAFYNDADEDKKVELFLEHNVSLKNQIISYANGRYESKKANETKELNKWKVFYTDTCIHCSYSSSFQPIRAERGEMEFTFYIYKCPECRNEFRAFLPFEKHEHVLYFKNFIDKFLQKDESGIILSERANFPKEHLEKMISGLKVFEENVILLDERLKDIKNIDDEYNLLLQKKFVFYGEVIINLKTGTGKGAIN